MATFREQKRKGRLQLHQRLAEPALYFATPSAEPLALTVRLHLSFDQIGELFNRIGFAERNEMTPRIVFLKEQVSPIRNAIVVTKDMGAFMLDNTMPPDDVTVLGEVVRMTNSQVVTLGWNPAADWLGLAPPEF